MEFFNLDFYDLHRKLPLTYISKDKQIATFTILGDVEFTEKAGEKLQAKLKKKKISPDSFVGPGSNVLPFVHHMAKRFGHLRYVILRKTVKNYMTQPEVLLPWRNSPKHARKLVINGADAQFLKGKKVVLIDDVVSTGVTIDMLEQLMTKIGAKTIAKCAIFKQGDRYKKPLNFLADLPIFVITKDGKKQLLTEER